MSTERKKNKGTGLRALAELFLLAKRLEKATAVSEEAQTEIMYGLPGIFSFALCSGGRSVRLIKEGNAFRIMKLSEKSDILTSVFFDDPKTLTSVATGRKTIFKALSEGRVSYKGAVGFFTTVMRVFYVADKLRLSDKKRGALYGDDAER